MTDPDSPAGVDDEIDLEDYIDVLNGDFYLE